MIYGTHDFQTISMWNGMLRLFALFWKVWVECNSSHESRQITRCSTDYLFKLPFVLASNVTHNSHKCIIDKSLQTSMPSNNWNNKGWKWRIWLSICIKHGLQYLQPPSLLGPSRKSGLSVRVFRMGEKQMLIIIAPAKFNISGLKKLVF